MDIEDVQGLATHRMQAHMQHSPALKDIRGNVLMHMA